LLLAVEADRLSNREDVCLIEGVLERTAAMPGSTEHHALRGHGWIGSARIVSVHQLRNIDQNRRLGRFPGFRMRPLKSLCEGTRLNIPDVPCVLCDGSVAGKLSGPGDVQDRLTCPFFWVRV